MLSLLSLSQCLTVRPSRRDRVRNQDTALQDAGLDKSTPGDIDDGLLRGFLASAIGTMWLRLASIGSVCRTNFKTHI